MASFNLARIMEWLKRKGNFRSASASPGTMDGLEEVAGSLESAVLDTEDDFVRLGKALQTIYFEADQLSKHTVETITLIGSEAGEGALTRIDGIVNSALDELESCRSNTGMELDRINEVISFLGRLHKTSSVVEQIAMSLRVVGLNIGIESSRSAESEELFGVIAQDVRLLAEKIIAIAETIRQDAREARTKQIDARAGITRGLDGLDQLAYDARNTVREAVGKIKYLIESSLSALEDARSHSDEISRDVGEIVVSIQLHDSVNQRIHHVMKALEEVREMTANPSGNSEEAGAAVTVLDLQVSHLNHPVSELREGYDTILSALDKIHGHVDKLTRSLSMEFTDGGGGLSAAEADLEEAFTDLVAALHHLNALLDRGYGLVKQIGEMAVEASVTAGRLSDYMEKVRQISMETHIIALNAIVKAAHLSETGKVLEVLSQEMKHLSDQADGYVEDVEGLIQSVNGSIEELQGYGAMDLVETADRGSLDGDIQGITESFDTFKVRSREANQKAESLKTSISHISDSLDFISDLADTLEDNEVRIEEIVNAIRPEDHRILGGIISWTDKLAARYTMQKEREIHHKRLPGDGSGEAVAALPEKTGPDERPGKKDRKAGEDADLGDNVELF